MNSPRSIRSLFVVGVIIAHSSILNAQSYPSKTIRIIAAEAGGSGDLVARIIAQGMSASLGQQVIVDNRGILAAEMVAKAPTDGYTLLLYGPPLWIGPLLRNNLPYDGIRDFAPITLAVSSPDVLVVHPSLPVKTVKDLIALAKARPGDLNYASGSSGGPPHLEAELFKAMAGINIVRIPYKGNASALTALMGGQVQIMFANGSQVALQLKSSRLRALAVTSAEPSPLIPGMPTMAASGLLGYESSLILGLLAPAKTPSEIITRINQEAVRVLTRPEVKERLFNTGVETVASTPEQFATRMKSEVARWQKLIKDVGIQDE